MSVGIIVKLEVITMNEINREILFRGLQPCRDGDTTIYVEGEAVKGRWVEGSLIFFSDGDSYICCEDVASDSLSKNEVIPSTVGQYTGVTDKNDRKIFEHDRLDLTDWAKRDRTVEVLGFHNGVCWFGGDGFSDEYIFNSSNRLVIGTIFDKPKESEKELCLIVALRKTI